MTFFPIHWKSFPKSARNHHKLCTSLFRGASFRHRFCSSCVVLPHLLPGEFELLFPWLAEVFVHPGRMERGRSQSQPWPGASLALGTEHSKWSCHNRLLKSDLMRISWIWQKPLGGERRMTGRVPGRCCFLRWMGACPPRVATNTGHSSDPNYSPDAGLKAKGIPSAIKKCDLPLPTQVSTWEENREFFLFQEDVFSVDAPLLLEHSPAPSKKGIPL